MTAALRPPVPSEGVQPPPLPLQWYIPPASPRFPPLASLVTISMGTERRLPAEENVLPYWSSYREGAGRVKALPNRNAVRSPGPAPAG